MGRAARVTAVAPRKSISTRERILDAAEHLIAQNGVYGFTLKDIADPLGVQVPAIYKHYESRDDVLIEVSKRFVALLSQQFQYPPEDLSQPTATLREVLDRFVEFHFRHPAYVRLSLTDLATPQGGMEYVRLAAGGPFRENLRAGPLAAMHRRLKELIEAGQRAGEFRPVLALNFYRVVKSTLLIQLVFPDDLLVADAQGSGATRPIKAFLWDVAYHYITAPRSFAKIKKAAAIR